MAGVERAQRCAACLITHPPTPLGLCPRSNGGTRAPGQFYLLAGVVNSDEPIDGAPPMLPPAAAWPLFGRHFWRVRS